MRRVPRLARYSGDRHYRQRRQDLGEGNDISGAVAALVGAENGQKPQ